MQLRMVIGEIRPEFRAVWREAFRDIEDVDVLEIDVPSLMRLPKADAMLMMGMFAHERYGGKPRPWESQVLSSQGEANMPPWIVTAPAIAAQLGQKRLPSDTDLIPDAILSHEEEDYMTFSKIFDRIDAFNSNSETPRIRILAFSQEFINMPRDDVLSEAMAVRRAYLEHYGKETNKR